MIQFDGSELNFVSANGFENGKWVWKGTDDAETNYADDSSRNERIYGFAGSDILMGGLGSDDLVGGEGDDVLYGNNANQEVDVDEIGIAFTDTAVFADKYSDVSIIKLLKVTLSSIRLKQHRKVRIPFMILKLLSFQTELRG